MALFRNYKKLPVEDLIALIADKNQEKIGLDKAFSEFHRRFINYMYKVCKNTCAIKCIFDQMEINKIAHDAIRRVYTGAQSFTPTTAELSEKEKHKRVCGWLGVIVHHEIQKYLDKIEKLKDKIILTENIDEYAAYVNSIIDEDEEISPPSLYQQLLEEGLSHISDRDKEITFTYLTYEDENGRIPTEILNRLLKKYKLLPKYPAKIKDRTIKKLMLINPKSLNQKTYDTKIEKSRKKARRKTKRFPPLDRSDDSADTGTG